jgi:hypothetical protein
LDNEDSNGKSTNDDQKRERKKGHKEGECNVWWLTFGVTMVFFVGYPLFKGIW